MLNTSLEKNIKRIEFLLDRYNLSEKNIKKLRKK